MEEEWDAEHLGHMAMGTGCATSPFQIRVLGGLTRALTRYLDLLLQPYPTSGTGLVRTGAHIKKR